MTGHQLDLNFRSDRAGARTVIESNIPKTIISIQTCGQTAVTESTLDQWMDCPSMAACALLPKMRQQIQFMPRFVNQAVKKRLLPQHRWRASPNLDHGFIPWDIVALLSVTHPEELFDEWEYHRVSFPLCAEDREPCDGTMTVEENLGRNFNGTNWSGIVRTPHRVRNETRLLEMMFSIIGEIPATSPRPPPLLWGFCGTFLSFTLATVIFLRFLYQWSRR